ncbi:hypothetical protein [Limoniibacter endophyticus]|uniref:Uncharacterized protein n=1 Tax=Limoniibacter endophyticus TaxID=1565040 RepID=A0A8J3DK37_9HYPH|nr:hypothetical protein [Limoniibacter endophyticus]GHC75294.1 hypothetical protein GCM10010136_24950 [Limoniibacter endophyticus]
MRLTLIHVCILSGGTVLLAAATGFAFAGWLEHGAQIFLVAAENGLSWCF